MSDESSRGAGPIEAVPGRSAEGMIEIDAPPERVWRALTEARELERWFPLEAKVEPGEGGTVYMSWKNEFAGTSNILAWDPPRHLRTSWEWGGQVTDYLLEGRGGRTTLRVVTSGFPEGGSWDEWIEGTRRGWTFELTSLRHYLERHDGEPRRVVYVRRRVDLSADEAWARLTGAGGLDPRWLGGRPFDDQAPVQVASVLTDPADALLRTSIEPNHTEEASRDVTLFLSAWGEAGKALDGVEEEWRGTLERVYPEGRTP